MPLIILHTTLVSLSSFEHNQIITCNVKLKVVMLNIFKNQVGGYYISAQGINVLPHDEVLLSYAWSRLTLSLVQWEGGGGGGGGMERGPPSRSSPSHRNRRLHLVALLSPGLLCRMAV